MATRSSRWCAGPAPSRPVRGRCGVTCSTPARWPAPWPTPRRSASCTWPPRSAASATGRDSSASTSRGWATSSRRAGPAGGPRWCSAPPWSPATQAAACSTRRHRCRYGLRTAPPSSAVRRCWGSRASTWRSSGPATSTVPAGWYASEVVARLRQPGRIAVVGSGENWWDPVHVEDVASALTAAAERARPGTLLHCADDEPLSYYDFVAATATELGVGPPRRIPVLLPGSSPARVPWPPSPIGANLKPAAQGRAGVVSAVAELDRRRHRPCRCRAGRRGLRRVGRPGGRPTSIWPRPQRPPTGRRPGDRGPRPAP